VPYGVWTECLPPRHAKGFTGYTHRWADEVAQKYKNLLMASVDNRQEFIRATARGWRVFLVVPRNKKIPKDLVWCPSDELNPKKSSCADCLLCSGKASNSKRHVAIFAHGPSRNTFGSQKRKPNEPVPRQKAEDTVFARIPRTIHPDCKAHAKACGQSLKAWTESALRAKLATQPTQTQ